MEQQWTQQDFINKGRHEKAMRIIQFIRRTPEYRERLNFTELEWDDIADRCPCRKPSPDTRSMVLVFLRGNSPKASPARPRPTSIIDETRTMLAKHIERGCEGCTTCAKFKSAIDEDDRRRRKVELEKAFEDF